MVIADGRNLALENIAGVAEFFLNSLVRWGRGWQLELNMIRLLLLYFN
jgi:hypothetical protein